MVDTEQRNLPCKGQGLSGRNPDAQRSDQAWPIRDDDSSGPFNPGDREGFVDDRNDGFHMRARGGFGHDPAPPLMHLDLAGDYVAQNMTADDDRRTRFVAACFDAKDWFTQEIHRKNAFPQELELSLVDNRFIMSLLCATFAILLGQGGASSTTPDGPASRELRRIKTEDQKDRQGLGDSPGKREHTKLAANDAKRLARVRELLRTDKVRTAADYDICALIFQHGRNADDFLVAHELAVIAGMKGSVGSLPALAEDRFLVTIGQKQRFGSQYNLQIGEGGNWLQDVDEGGRFSVTDSLRLVMFVPTLEIAKIKPASEAIKACMNQMLARAETRFDPEWRKVMEGLDTHTELRNLPVRIESSARAEELYQSDLLFVPADFHHAARIIAVNPATSAQWLAHELATVAVMRGDRSALPVWRKTWDAAVRASGKGTRFEPAAKTLYPGVRRELGG